MNAAENDSVLQSAAIDGPSTIVAVPVLVPASVPKTHERRTRLNYTGPDDPIGVYWFPIEELSIAGSVGSLKSSGKQPLKAFSEQSRILYTLTYQ
jgi:hypothetical protein